MDSSGALYGTTNSGGTRSSGTLYKLIPVSGGKWRFRDLYNFCSAPADCTDGGVPWANVIFDKSGALVGTTYGGGGYDYDLYGMGGGVVFRWHSSYRKIHSFCSKGDRNCADGMYPHGQMVMDAEGNLFGTTEGGGKYHSGGVVFEITP
jgi:hypothetical protein